MKNELLPTLFHITKTILYTCLLPFPLSAVQINVTNNSATKTQLHHQETSQTLEKVSIEDQVSKLRKPPLDDNKKEELFKAVKNNNLNKVRWFLDTYKDVVKARGQYEVTPFHCAALNGYLAIAKLLKENGAKFENTNKYRDNALHLSCYFLDNTEMVSWILDECDTSLVEAKGLSATLRGKLKVLRLALSQ